jgi:nicotinamide-nucleotide amidase
MIPAPDDKALDTLARRLGERLLAAGRMAATAESCTGGWIAKVVTDIAGSSAWFDRGFVTYTNEAKQDLLGVRADTLAVYGAVSEASVREMVAGALARSRADVAVAVSGIAGPGGGSPDKPVGTVWLAWGTRGGLARAERCRFDGDREAVRRQAVARALQGMDELLG